MLLLTQATDTIFDMYILIWDTEIFWRKISSLKIYTTPGDAL